MARGDEHALDIHLHDPAPLLQSHLGHSAGTADPDIVVEAVEPAELRERALDHCARLLLVSDIGDERSGSATLFRDHRHSAFGALAVEIDDEDFCAGACQQDRRRAAVADPVVRRSAAGDDRHLAGEPEIVALAWLRHPRSPLFTFTRQAIWAWSPEAGVRRATSPSGVAALLAPQAELLLHRAVGVAEEHRLVL